MVLSFCTRMRNNRLFLWTPKNTIGIKVNTKPYDSMTSSGTSNPINIIESIQGNSTFMKIAKTIILGSMQITKSTFNSTEMNYCRRRTIPKTGICSLFKFLRISEISSNFASDENVWPFHYQSRLIFGGNDPWHVLFKSEKC